MNLTYVPGSPTTLAFGLMPAVSLPRARILEVSTYINQLTIRLQFNFASTAPVYHRSPLDLSISRLQDTKTTTLENQNHIVTTPATYTYPQHTQHEHFLRADVQQSD